MSLKPPSPGTPGFNEWRDLADAVDAAGVVGAGVAPDRYTQWEKAGHIAYFLEKSAARLHRLVQAAAPKAVICNELLILKRRIADIEAALPWTESEIAELDKALSSSSASDGVSVPDGEPSSGKTPTT